MVQRRRQQEPVEQVWDQAVKQRLTNLVIAGCSEVTRKTERTVTKSRSVTESVTTKKEVRKSTERGQKRPADTSKETAAKRKQTSSPSGSAEQEGFNGLGIAKEHSREHLFLTLKVLILNHSYGVYSVLR